MTTTFNETAIIGSAIDLAKVFVAGGRLVVVAPGRHDHARHVAVEFIHPAITGARALPAVAVEAGDLVTITRETDAVLVIEDPNHGSCDVPPNAPTIRVAGRDQPLAGPHLVRWYHLLWELVQLAFDDQNLTSPGNDEATDAANEGGDSTNFLYPFLDSSDSEDETLEATLAASAETKFVQSDELCAATVEQNSGALDAATADLVASNAAGGTVLAIGNGGSACDAARLVRLLSTQGIRATCLADDPAVLTALANDLGANMMFSRQLEASMQPIDVLFAFSTSGSSPNLLAALDAPTAAGASIIACAGYGGGALCEHANVDHRLIVDSSSVHRVQEAQSALVDQLIKQLSEKVNQ